MNKPANEVERVVREVLAELGVAPSGSPLPPGKGRGQRGADLVVAAPRGDDGGSRRPAGVGAAPAGFAGGGGNTGRSRGVARRHVTLVDADSADGHSAAATRLVLMLCGTTFNPAGLIAAATREGFDVHRTASDCLTAAIDELAGSIAGAERARRAADRRRRGRRVPGKPAAGCPGGGGRRCRHGNGRRLGGGRQPVGGRSAGALVLPTETDDHGVLPRRGSPLPGSLPRKTRLGASSCELPTSWEPSRSTGPIPAWRRKLQAGHAAELGKPGDGRRGQSLKKAVPFSRERLDEIAVYDELGAGIGSRIAISEGREAAMPFHPELKPVDAYNAAILDSLNYELP